jgi:hypothetical protein
MESAGKIIAAARKCCRTPTKALNRAVKRNKDRFPEDFLFLLTGDKIMRCQIGTASKRNRRYRP